MFPQEEEKAASIVKDARSRFETSEEGQDETRSEFWASTVVAPRPENRSPRRPRRKRRRWPWSVEIVLGVAVLTVLAVLLPRERAADPPRVVAPPPVAITAPIVTQRKIEELPPPPPSLPPAPVVRAAKKKPPPRPAVPPKAPERSEIARRMSSLQERGAGKDDREVQSFVADLEQRARGNPSAESEMKKVALCLIDRSCGSDRLYRRLSSAIRAIDQSSAALSP